MSTATPATTTTEPAAPAATPTEPAAPASLVSEPATPVAPEFVPLTADVLKFPAGFTVDEASRDQFLAVANESKFSPETVGKLVELQAGLMKNATEASTQAFVKMNDDWQKEVLSHQDYAGDKIKEVLPRISKVIDQFGTKELRDVMTLTGAGNNIHVVQFLDKISKVLKEGSPVVSGAPGGQLDLASKIYTTMAKGN